VKCSKIKSRIKMTNNEDSKKYRHYVYLQNKWKNIVVKIFIMSINIQILNCFKY